MTTKNIASIALAINIGHSHVTTTVHVFQKSRILDRCKSILNNRLILNPPRKISTKNNDQLFHKKIESSANTISHLKQYATPGATCTPCYSSDGQQSNDLSGKWYNTNTDNGALTESIQSIAEQITSSNIFVEKIFVTIFIPNSSVKTMQIPCVKNLSEENITKIFLINSEKQFGEPSKNLLFDYQFVADKNANKYKLIISVIPKPQLLKQISICKETLSSAFKNSQPKIKFLAVYPNEN